MWARSPRRVSKTGLYFAESCTKADEYARDDTGHYSDVRALLLCRVCMGSIHYTTEPEPDALQKFLDGERDTRWRVLEIIFWGFPRTKRMVYGLFIVYGHVFWTKILPDKKQRFGHIVCFETFVKLQIQWSSHDNPIEIHWTSEQIPIWRFPEIGRATCKSSKF